MRTRARFISVVSLLAGTSFFLTACGKKDASPAESAVGASGTPATVAQVMADFGVDWGSLGPVESLEAMVDIMTGEQLRDMWEMMPQGYRDDMESLLREFADKLDPEVYEQWANMMNKAVDVLNDKRSMLTSTAVAIGLNVPDPDQFADGVEGMIEMMEILMDSDVGSYETFRRMDIGEFLAEAGPRLQNLDPNRGSGGPLRGLRDATFELISSEGDRATVYVSGAPGGRDREMDLIRVEDRWMPADIVNNWDRGIGRTRQMLERVDFNRYRMAAMTAISAMDGTLDAIAEAQDEIELSEILRMSGRMGRMGGFRPEQ